MSVKNNKTNTKIVIHYTESKRDAERKFQVQYSARTILLILLGKSFAYLWRVSGLWTGKGTGLRRTSPSLFSKSLGRERGAQCFRTATSWAALILRNYLKILLQYSRLLLWGCIILYFWWNRDIWIKLNE